MATGADVAGADPSVQGPAPVPCVHLTQGEIADLRKLFETVLFPKVRMQRASIEGDILPLGVVRSGMEAERTAEFPDVMMKLNGLLRKYLPMLRPQQFEYWTTMQINRNTVAKPHIDKSNLGRSALLCFGDFVAGGRFAYTVKPSADPSVQASVVAAAEAAAVDINNAITIIDGKRWHRSFPASGGDRYSVVFYVHNCFKSVADIDRDYLMNHGFNFPPVAVANDAPSADPSAHGSAAAAAEDDWINLIVRLPNGEEFLMKGHLYHQCDELCEEIGMKIGLVWEKDFHVFYEQCTFKWDWYLIETQVVDGVTIHVRMKEHAAASADPSVQDSAGR